MTDANTPTTFETSKERHARTLSTARRWCVVGLVVGGLGGSLVSASYGAEPVPQPTRSAGTAVPRLPVIDAGQSTHVEGKIIRTSRGRKGPVRLLVERKSGDQVTILVASDELCDRVGLSLQSGETVDVEGALVKGERPILIASAFKMPDGKTIRIRDASGNLIDAGTAGAATTGEAGHKATLSGAKPSASPAQK
jgi:hypothetical protein